MLGVDVVVTGVCFGGLGMYILYCRISYAMLGVDVVVTGVCFGGLGMYLPHFYNNE